MKGVVAAGDIQTARAGERILKLGGNAYDAAIATILAAPLCEPVFTSLGGGGFMITQSPTCKPIIYDFFVDVPKNNKQGKDFFPIDVDFGSAVQEFHIGLASSAIPGLVKGVWQIYKDFATMDMSELIQPALQYAREGIYLSSYQADFMKLLYPMFSSQEVSRQIYCPNGNLLDATTLYKNQQYGDFLEEFSIKGESLFYEGEVAKNIAQYCEKNGGLLTQESLKQYKIHKREPISIQYNNYDIYLNPPPSSGGILIAFSMLLLQDKKDLQFGSKEFVHSFLESLKSTSNFRKEYVDAFLHDANLKTILNNKEIVSAFQYEMNKRLNIFGNTTHLSILDEEQNAISITTTNGEGCGHIIPNTGIMFNNMLGEEDLNPNGFFQWQSGIRLPSMMCPTLLSKNNQTKLTLGAAGSNRIRSAILNTILGYMNTNDIQHAINLPRAHLDKGILYMEKGFMKSKLDYGYELKYFDELNLFFGGVQGVTCKLEGGGDIRRGGGVIQVT